jgi:hypothetical protein
MAFSRLLTLGALFVLLSGCAASELNSADAARPARPLYRPGESLDARLCACKECFEHACCSGEPEAAEASNDQTGNDETQLGISVSACGRCVRRTWTVRGSASCASRAPSECCGGSLVE